MTSKLKNTCISEFIKTDNKEQKIKKSKRNNHFCDMIDMDVSRDTKYAHVVTSCGDLVLHQCTSDPTSFILVL